MIKAKIESNGGVAIEKFDTGQYGMRVTYGSVRVAHWDLAGVNMLRTQ